MVIHPRWDVFFSLQYLVLSLTAFYFYMSFTLTLLCHLIILNSHFLNDNEGHVCLTFSLCKLVCVISPKLFLSLFPFYFISPCLTSFISFLSPLSPFSSSLLPSCPVLSVIYTSIDSCPSLLCWFQWSCTSQQCFFLHIYYISTHLHTYTYTHLNTRSY